MPVPRVRLRHHQARATSGWAIGQRRGVRRPRVSLAEHDAARGEQRIDAALERPDSEGARLLEQVPQRDPDVASGASDGTGNPRRDEHRLGSGLRINPSQQAGHAQLFCCVQVGRQASVAGRYSKEWSLDDPVSRVLAGIEETRPASGRQQQVEEGCWSAHTAVSDSIEET